MSQLRAALCFQLPQDGNVPEWIELVPAPAPDGLIRGRDGRVFRMAAAIDVASRFDLRLPVDVNHSTEIAAPDGRDSPAMGWVEALEARDNALWGRIEWTDDGALALRGKKYRFVSPAFTHAKNGEIHALTSVGLTNKPNFNLALNATTDEEPPMSLSALILTALGLQPNASENDALVAINSLKTDKQVAVNAASNPPLEKFVPRADYDSALNRASTAEGELKGIREKTKEAEIEAAVNAAQKAGKIVPATRDYYISMCRREGGLEEFNKFVAAAPPVIDPGSTGADKLPAQQQGAMTEKQRALCSQLGIAEKDYQAALGSSV